MNIRLIATEVGDALKYNTSVNEINRIGKEVFPFPCDIFPNEVITSQRAILIYNWIMSLGKHRCTPDERVTLLTIFIKRLAPEGELRTKLLQILRDAG